MKKTTRTILWLSLFCFFSAPSFSQQEETPQKNYAIGWHPFTLFDMGLSVDFDMRVKNTNDWLCLRLTGYYGGKSDPDDEYYSSWISSASGWKEYSALSGLGVELAYKRYFSKNLYYYGLGVGYHYFDVSYLRDRYVPFEEKGLTYYSYKRNHPESQYFNRIKPSLLLGFRSPVSKNPYVEGFVSLSYAYSFYDANKKPYNNTMYGFGYRGMTFGVGGKIGWSF